MLRIVVPQDLETGVAEQPWWGPMYGAEAVSEQYLAERALDPLPAGAIVMGDRNFGIFATAYAAHRRGHRVVIRMQAHRAQAILGGPIPTPPGRKLSDIGLSGGSPAESRRQPGLAAPLLRNNHDSQRSSSP
jgi:hypothetical protein